MSFLVNIRFDSFIMLCHYYILHLESSNRKGGDKTY